MAFLGVFGLKIGKIFVIFGMSTLKFMESQKSIKTKNQNLGPKMSYLGISGLEF